MSGLEASEQRDIDATMELLPKAEEVVSLMLSRVEPHAELLRPGARVLELGATQGAYLIVLEQKGFDAAGIEPWAPAVETGRELSRRTGVETELIEAAGEDLPFDEGEFDFVFAISVMEHVRDPKQVFREASRVLRPGGSFYFHTTSALAYRQDEIRYFPLFAWYPAPVKRRIMDWVVRKHPSWVGGTETPAVNWFTPWGVRRDLAAAGFSQVLERWDMVPAEELGGWRGRMLETVRSSRALRAVGEFAKPGSGYLAIK